MNRITLFLFSIVLLSSCAGGGLIDARYSYDQEKDYSTLRTYNWFPGAIERFENPLYGETFQRIVDRELASKGLQLTSNNPDFLVRTYTPRKYRERYLKINGVAQPIPQAQLRFDFVDPESTRSIWEGVATAVVDAEDASEEKLNQLISQAIIQLLEEFPPTPEAQ